MGPGDVPKILAFGILGNMWKVVELLNKYHPDWRRAL